jgi:hypothetical protein
MGNPLKAAEDVVEYKDKNWIINSLLKIVTLLSYQLALAASHAVLLGECQYQLLIEKKLHTWLDIIDYI